MGNNLKRFYKFFSPSSDPSNNVKLNSKYTQEEGVILKNYVAYDETTQNEKEFGISNLHCCEIPQNEIEFISCLKYNRMVYYGIWKSTIKVFVKRLLLYEEQMLTQSFLEEVAIIKKLRHERFVAFYGTYSKTDSIYVVQEYMSKGSLLDFLIKRKDKKLKVEELVDIALQIASGMEYLESRQLIHLDLAARNVFVGKNNVVKINSFGLVRVNEDNEYCPKQGSSFPIKWMAPEAIMFGKFSIKSNVWSYGILLMELFTYGQIPYPGLTNTEVMDRVQSGYRMPKPTNHYIPYDIYNVMLVCWDANSENRPTFEFLSYYFEEFRVT